MNDPVLVIGGNSGIGLETVRKFQAQGTPMVVAARTAGPLPEMGITVQPFDAANPQPLDLPERLGGVVYFPGSISLKPFHRLGAENFLSDSSKFLTGQVLRPDGGLSSVRTF